MIDENSKEVTLNEATCFLNSTGVLADCKITTGLNLDDAFKGKEISKRYTFDNVVFSSQVDLSDSIFQKRLKFINCVFCGPVDLSDSIFRGNIQFIDCIFKRRISAVGTEFTGDVEFKNCFVLTDDDDDFNFPNRPFYFARAKINLITPMCPLENIKALILNKKTTTCSSADLGAQILEFVEKFRLQRTHGGN